MSVGVVVFTSDHGYLWFPGDDGDMAGSVSASVLSAMRSSMNAIQQISAQSCRP
jgi:hypothetical protein